MEIFNNAQFGVLRDGGSVDHVDLGVHDNGDVGIWALGATHLSITGSDAEIVGNHDAGIDADGAPFIGFELLDHLRAFLLELGSDFCFMGRQCRISVT